jgi:hypothetical protein
LPKLFGFVQFDFAGTLPLADGRYLASSAEGGDETVLVLHRLGASAHAERRRRRGRSAPADPEPAPVSLTRATAIRAASPFEDQVQAARWLDEACEAEDTAEALAAEAIAILNRALHAQAVAAADPYGRQLTPEQTERVLLGYGSGEETADGQFTDARQIDLTPRAASRRRQREEELRPQERVAAILRGREQLDSCETLLLRARADLDAGRDREAALQLRIGLEALLRELDGAIDDPDHQQDMTTLRERQAETASAEIEETLGICERVLRRRRVLGD